MDQLKANREVLMSVRRRSSRLQVLNAEGVLRVWRDVVGHRTDAGEYVVVTDEAGIKGECLTVYFASRESIPMPVRVVDSQPIILDGSVHHQLRLSPLVAESFDSQNTARDTSLEAE
jgi:hypothetical protein